MATELQQAVAIRQPDVSVAVQSEPLEQISEFDKYRGMSMRPATEQESAILLDPVASTDVEIRPDGMIYLPEIKYRRRLNKAYGPGGWALRPMSPFTMRDNTIMRQFALYVLGNFVSEAVGEQEYIEKNPNMTYATASEGCKSNAMMRCCKDLGIASELWDPEFIEKWRKEFAVKVWNNKKNRFEWRRKDRDPFSWEKNDQPQSQPIPVTVQNMIPVQPKMEQPPQPEDEYPEQPPMSGIPMVDENLFNQAAAETAYHSPDKCGKCGAALVYHETGQWGPWWGCSQFKNGCKFSISKKKWDAETKQA